MSPTELTNGWRDYALSWPGDAVTPLAHLYVDCLGMHMRGGDPDDIGVVFLSQEGVKVVLRPDQYDNCFVFESKIGWSKIGKFVKIK